MSGKRAQKRRRRKKFEENLIKFHKQHIRHIWIPLSAPRPRSWQPALTLPARCSTDEIKCYSKPSPTSPTPKHRSCCSHFQMPMLMMLCCCTLAGEMLCYVHFSLVLFFRIISAFNRIIKRGKKWVRHDRWCRGRVEFAVKRTLNARELEKEWEENRKSKRHDDMSCTSVRDN